MVAHRSFELLEVSATLRHPIARALVSTNFALVPGWNIPNWSTTFSLGAETSIVLQDFFDFDFAPACLSAARLGRRV